MAHAFPFIMPQFFDANGNPLAGGSLYSYAAGTSTPLATYTDQTEGTPNTNPVVLDANGRAAIWIGSSAYKFILKDSLGNTIWTYDNVSHINNGYITVGMLSNSTVLYRWGGSAGGGANAITLTPADTLPAYSTGLRYAFLATATNTGAMTVNISGLGPKPMTAGDTTPLASGQILSGSMYSMTYDGTEFRVHELVTIAANSITRAKLGPDARDWVVPATVTANATVSYANDLYLVDCTSGPVTLTMFAASSGCKPIRIKKIDTTFNAVTIQRAGSDTIQDVSSGASSVALYLQGEELTIVAASSTTFQVVNRVIATVFASAWVSAAFIANTTTPINFDTKESDVLNLITTSSSAWKLTAPAPGVYDVIAYLPNTATSSYGFLRKNGVGYKSITFTNGSPSWGVTTLRLNAGDYIDICPGSSTTYVGNVSLATANANIAVKRSAL